MLCNGIIDQDCKIFKNHIDGDVTLDTIHFSSSIVIEVIGVILNLFIFLFFYKKIL